MTKRRWVYIDGEAVEITEDTSFSPTPMVQADLPSFVSPIDGKTYTGRAGMREHCKKHNVVPLDEMKGVKAPTKEEQHKKHRTEVREALIAAAYKNRLFGFKP